MPRKLVTTDGQTFRFRDEPLPALAANDVRVRVRFAAPKHGTETHVLGGSVQDRKRWDPTLRLFLPRTGTQLDVTPNEYALGNMVVGTVSEVGPSVTTLHVGDEVFGYGPICEKHQAAEKHWRPLHKLAPQDAVCTDPAHVAFVAVRDGNIRIGDDVAVFGLGAIGLMAVQIARASGAQHVAAVDPIARRRDCAQVLGATQTLDPTQGDMALAIKRATGNHGVDVAIETSGSGSALNDAIRCIRQCGTVVHVPWGPKDASALHLDEEFHLNRPTIVGSQAWPGWGNPDRDHPLWDAERAYQTVVNLFADGTLHSDEVVDPIIDFEDAPAYFTETFPDAEHSVKVGVRLSNG